jgi:hypothetical protein
MFVAISHFHPSLIFASKSRSLYLEWSRVRGVPSLAFKYQTRLKVTDSDNTLAQPPGTKEKSYIVFTLS